MKGAIVQKLSVPIKSTLSTCSVAAYVRASSAHQAAVVVAQFISNGTNHVCVRLNLVNHGWVLHMKSSYHLRLIGKISLLRLRLSTSGSTSSHGSSSIWVASSLCSSGYSEGFWNCWLSIGCSYELPPPEGRHVASFTWTWAQRSAIDKLLMPRMIKASLPQTATK